MFEVEIPKERQPVPDDGPKVSGEALDAAKREEKRKASEFIAQFRKSAGLSK
jgi:hypothetical protein